MRASSVARNQNTTDPNARQRTLNAGSARREATGETSAKAAVEAGRNRKDEAQESLSHRQQKVPPRRLFALAGYALEQSMMQHLPLL